MNRRFKIIADGIIIVSIIVTLVLYNVYANLNRERLREYIIKEFKDLDNYITNNLTIIKTPITIRNEYLNILLDKCIRLINSIESIIGSYEGEEEIVERFNIRKSLILNISNLRVHNAEDFLVDSLWELGYIMGYIQADMNYIKYSDIENQVAQINNELSKVKTEYLSRQKLKLDTIGSYRIRSLLEDHIFAVQTIIEGEIYEANRLINQTMELAYMSGRPFEHRIGMAVSTIMGIQVMMTKVNMLLDNYKVFYTSDTLSNIYYSMLSKFSLNQLENVPGQSFANLTLTEANNYLNMAEDEAGQNLYAKAIIDLMIAEILYDSINDLISIPDPFLKTTNVNIAELIETKNNIITKLDELNKTKKIDKLILSRLLFYPIEDLRFVQVLMNRRIELNKIDNTALTYYYAFLKRVLVYLENLNKMLVSTKI